MALHQGQGHCNAHEQICRALVHRHAKYEYHSLNTVQDMAINIIVQVKRLSSLRRNCDSDSE